MSNKTEQARDDKVLELREKRRSFVAIAGIVGFEKSAQARAAFNRALRRRPPKEQDALRKAELARLDALAKQVKHNSELTAEAIARKLGAVDRARAQLLAP